MRRIAVWPLAVSLAVVPTAIAASSPLNAGRDLVWIAGGMAGVLALAFLFFQPLLAAGWLPGLRRAATKRWHRRIGALVVAAVIVHVGGLYLVSPEDVVDSLLLASPTPFALYGVVGLWAVVATACLAAVRRRLGLSVWRILHTVLAAVVAISAVAHALLIEGVMGETSKLVLCLALLAATAAVALRFAIAKPLRPTPTPPGGAAGN